MINERHCASNQLVSENVLEMNASVFKTDRNALKSRKKKLNVGKSLNKKVVGRFLGCLMEVKHIIRHYRRDEVNIIPDPTVIDIFETKAK